MTKQYKYKCRECIPRVRQMCIQEAQISPGAKRIIERAFESHTDTEATWDLLQRTCLLMQRDQMIIDDGEPKQSSLWGRMRSQDTAGISSSRPTQPPVVGEPRPKQRDSLLSRLQAREQKQEEEPPPVIKPRTDEFRRTTYPPADHSQATTPSWSEKPSTPTYGTERPTSEPHVPSWREKLSPPAHGTEHRPTELKSSWSETSSTPSYGVEQPPAPADEILETDDFGFPTLETSPPPWEEHVSAPEPTIPSWLEKHASLRDKLESPTVETPSEGHKLEQEHIETSAIETPYESSSLLDRIKAAERGAQPLSPGLEVAAPSSSPQRPGSGPSAMRLSYPAAIRPQPIEPEIPGPRVLVADDSGHRILLPENGELVLGRFDPFSRAKPDVDLTYEDRLHRGISRRHASVSGWQGRYEITDLGSSNGTWINGERLRLQSTPTLQVGDEIRLGNCVLYLDVVPRVYEAPPLAGLYFFYVNFTGTYIPLPNKDTLLIGRADPALGFQPDIDLGPEGDIASVVSRRHARLTRRGTEFLIEDLGSAYKTKIDGELVYVGVQMPIRPGQHLWLGGCILAFDVIERPNYLAL